MGFLSRRSGGIKTFKTDAMIVHAGDLVEVVGESYYQDALRCVAAIATSPEPFLDELTGYARKAAEEDRGERWFRAALICEPDNKYDCNAIAIYAVGVGEVGQLSGKVGHLSRDDAIEYQPVFEALSAHDCSVAACPAFLIGGTKEKPSYGVLLCLSTPERIIADLAETS
ncbi:MAG: hypothetical protein ABSB96_01790 [Gaiellaceae bacterium]